MPFYLTWQQNGVTLRGRSGSTWVDGQLTYPVAFPGQYSETEIITLASSARESGSLEKLTGLKLYLTGNINDVTQVQTVWPVFGNTFTPARPDANGGFEISFDHGRTYTRFDATHGLESSPSTWIQVPASSIGLGAVDGVLGPFDQATFYVRYKVPALATNLKLLDIRLAAGFDIL